MAKRDDDLELTLSIISKLVLKFRLLLLLSHTRSACCLTILLFMRENRRYVKRQRTGAATSEEASMSTNLFANSRIPTIGLCSLGTRLDLSLIIESQAFS